MNDQQNLRCDSYEITDAGIDGIKGMTGDTISILISWAATSNDGHRESFHIGTLELENEKGLKSTRVYELYSIGGNVEQTVNEDFVLRVFMKLIEKYPPITLTQKWDLKRKLEVGK